MCYNNANCCIYSPNCPLGSGLVMFLPPHHIPMTMRRELCLWSLGSVGVVWDNKHSCAQVSIATPHDPKAKCLIKNRCRWQPDIKVGHRGEERKMYSTPTGLHCKLCLLPETQNILPNNPVPVAMNILLLPPWRIQMLLQQGQSALTCHTEVCVF